MTKTDINKKAMLEAMEKALGVVTTACKRVGISRDTYYRWYNQDEKFRKAIDDLENVALDFAESKLHEQINDNNTAATIFYLKTKGKKRGYVERTEHDISNKRPDLSELSTQDIISLLNE